MPISTWIRPPPLCEQGPDRLGQRRPRDGCHDGSDVERGLEVGRHLRIGGENGPAGLAGAPGVFCEANTRYPYRLPAGRIR